MAFFNQVGGGGFEPKRKFRFLVSFSKLKNLTFMAKTAEKPSYDMTAAEHNILNHVFKFPGVVKWEDVTITFIDAVDPNTGSKFYNALRNSGYVLPTSVDALTHGVTKVGSHAALGLVRVQQLDGGGVIPLDGVDPGDKAFTALDSPDIVDEWTLHNAFIKSVKFGDLDYSTEDLIEISVGLTFDYASYSGTAVQYNASVT